MFQLAVAATLSSGMQLITCTVKRNRGVTFRVSDVTMVTISAIQERGGQVEASLQCSMRTGQVTGCLAGSTDFKEVWAGENSLEIGELTPFSL